MHSLENIAQNAVPAIADRLIQQTASPRLQWPVNRYVNVKQSDVFRRSCQLTSPLWTANGANQAGTAETLHHLCQMMGRSPEHFGQLPICKPLLWALGQQRHGMQCQGYRF